MVEVESMRFCSFDYVHALQAFFHNCAAVPCHDVLWDSVELGAQTRCLLPYVAEKVQARKVTLAHAHLQVPSDSLSSIPPCQWIHAHNLPIWQATHCHVGPARGCPTQDTTPWSARAVQTRVQGGLEWDLHTAAEHPNLQLLSQRSSGCFQVC